MLQARVGLVWAVALLTGWSALSGGTSGPATAQEVKPVVVVSVAKIDRLMGSIGYLTRAAGVPEVGGLVTLAAGQYLQGFDTKRPVGAYVTVRDERPSVVVFAPISDFKTIRDRLREAIDEPTELEGGILKYRNDRPVYVKPAGNWAFASDNDKNLANLPADPAALLGGLDKTYDIAVRVLADNVPQELRDKAVAEVRKGFDQIANRAPNNLDKDVQQKLQRTSLDQLIAFIQESDQLTFGWAIDSQGERTFLDVALNAKPGTNLATQMANLGDRPSKFSGFRLPEAAASVQFIAPVADRDKEQIRLALSTLKTQALKEIDEDKDLDKNNARAAAKEIVTQCLDVLSGTLDQGVIDGGAVLLLENKSLSVAVGGLVSDGKVLENALRKLADLGKDEADFPKIKFDAEKYQGVAFHTASIPLPEDEKDARRVLGDRLDVVVGAGPQSVYAAIGKNGTELLKKVIDVSAAAAADKSPPVRLTIALSPILKFAASLDDNALLNILSTTIDQFPGKDNVEISATGIERGVRYRIEVEEGVLQLIGQAAKSRGGAR